MKLLKSAYLVVLLSLFSFFYVCAQDKTAPVEAEKLIGIHLHRYTSDALLEELALQLPQLAQKGINLIFLRVNYNFDFQSYPELRDGPTYITLDGARQFSTACEKAGIRLVPVFKVLSHQSWGNKTSPLLIKYPELDITPGEFPNNEGIYCREWDPTNPRVNEIVFPLLDEIVDAFRADALHIGMDEVFLLGSEKSPTTHGKDPAALFAKVVTEFHDYFVKKRGLEMFMWGDRLIDGEKYKYGMWETSQNGTAPAIDMISRDIIICDWHYKPMPSYPTVDMFLEKGFRVLPSSKKNEEAIESLIKHSFKLNHPRMLGHLFTTFRSTWDTLKTYPPLLKGMEVINSQKFYDVSLDLKIEEGQERVPKVVLWVNHPNAVIRYTTNGSQPGLQSPEYSAPIVVKKSMEVKALAFSENKPIGEISERKFINHKGLGSKITILSKTHRESQYLDKEKNLVDGKLGINLMADGQWVGFGGASMQVALDLGKKQSISTVSINFSTHSGNWASSPGRMEIYGSLDGNSFELLADQAAGPEIGEMDILSASFEPFDVQFVKIIVYPQLIPEGQEGGGNMGFLFIGELIVD